MRDIRFASKGSFEESPDVGAGTGLQLEFTLQRANQANSMAANGGFPKQSPVWGMESALMRGDKARKVLTCPPKKECISFCPGRWGGGVVK